MDISSKIADFSGKMKELQNRRLARFAISKNQGWWRNYTALPYYMKYNETYKVDQITDKYTQLTKSTEPNDIDTLKLVDDIFTTERSFVTYFGGSIIALIIVIVLFVVMFLLMFEVIPQPSKTITIICGVSIGLLMALPLFKIFGCDLYPFIAWWKTSGNLKNKHQ